MYRGEAEVVKLPMAEQSMRFSMNSPAARAQPQLPIRIASDGTLVALGDFSDPIGPGYWDRPDHSQ